MYNHEYMHIHTRLAVVYLHYVKVMDEFGKKKTLKILQLVAGSGAPQGDPNGSPGRTDEAVPGPITRLFVIANRGISNLIQDIILVS